MIHHNGDGEKSKKYSETTRFESVAMNDSNESLVGGHVTSFEIDQTNFEVENLVEKPHAKWWHAAFHSTCAIVGAGVLGLPYAFSYLGWAAGLVTLITLTAISFYTSWLLAQLHEYNGARFDTYREIGESVWGKTKGFWAVVPVQYTLMVGLCITYAVTAGQSLKGVASSDCKGTDCEEGIAVWIVIFGLVQLALAQLPNFHSLWWVSLLGAICSIGYCGIAAGASAAYATNNPSPPSSRLNESSADHVFGVLNALGGVAFTFGGQAVLPEIQATLASPPPTPPTMMAGVSSSYLVVISTYFSVAVAGYAAFGGYVEPDVLLSVSKPLALVDAANFMVVLHVAAGYQIFAMPIFEAMEMSVHRHLQGRAPRAIVVRLILRSLFVIATVFVACLIPFFGDLMGLIASIGLMPVTFILPPLLWISSGRCRGRSEAALNAGIAGGSIVLAVLAFVGSLRNLIVHSKNYEVFD